MSISFIVYGVAIFLAGGVLVIFLCIGYTVLRDRKNSEKGNKQHRKIKQPERSKLKNATKAAAVFGPEVTIRSKKGTESKKQSSTKTKKQRQTIERIPDRSGSKLPSKTRKKSRKKLKSSS